MRWRRRSSPRSRASRYAFGPSERARAGFSCTSMKRPSVPAATPAGVAAGIDGLFMEVHENPARALSDGPNAYRLGRLRALLVRLQRIERAARPRRG